MNFEFKCPQCGQMVEADDSYCGQVAQCPHCGKGVVIPRRKPNLGIQRTDKGIVPDNKTTTNGPSAPQKEPKQESKETNELLANCPHCGTEYKIDKDDIGKTLHCHACGKKFVSQSNSASQQEKNVLQATNGYRPSSNIPNWLCVGILSVNLLLFILIAFLLLATKAELLATKAELLATKAELHDIKVELTKKRASPKDKYNLVGPEAISVVIEGTRYTDGDIYLPRR